MALRLELVTCRLLPFCKSVDITCNGDRKPWCDLELRLKNNSLPQKEMEKLKSLSIIKHLGQLSEVLKDKEEINYVLHPGSTKFSCPFLKTSIDTPCSLLLCIYNTPKVARTHCFLSYERTNARSFIPLEEWAVVKGLTSKAFLEILLAHTIGKWDMVENVLGTFSKKLPVCTSCGHLMQICKKNPGACKTRTEALNTLQDDEIPRSVRRYPMILITKVVLRLFGAWSRYILPSRINALYNR